MRTTTAILAPLLLLAVAVPAAGGAPRAPTRSVHLMVSPGLADDLGAATGVRHGGVSGAGAVTVERALRASYGYGVDLVTVWGPVAVGLTIDPSSGAASPTGRINGQEVAMMTAQLTGRAAARLYDAIAPGGLTSAHADVPLAMRRVSPAGRVECTRYESGETVCTVAGVVSMSTGG